MTAPGRMRDVKQNIDAFGQHLFRVFGEGTTPDFTYTIGNADRGVPELLLIGDLPSHIAAGLLNELGAKMREVWRDNLDETAATIWMRFLCRGEVSLSV